MKKIFKYELNIAGDMTILYAPIEQLLKVDWQEGTGAVLWAVIDEELENKTWRIMSLGTGWTIPDGVDDYIGTVQDDFGYVWHYFLLHTQELEEEKDFKEALAVLAQSFGKVGASVEEASKAFDMRVLFENDK